MSIYEGMSQGDEKNRLIINGVLTGIITNNQDPEKMGRVKIKFVVREIETETDWAPVCMLMASKECGTYFLPTVGDNVLVAFMMGDFQQPFVIGCLWDSKNKPPLGENKENAIKKIKSTKGHEIILDDSSKAMITIKTAGGMSVVMEDKKNITVKTAGGLAIKMDDSGKAIEIDGGGSKITANAQGIKIEGKMVKIESTMLELKGTKVTLEGTATEIKGTPLLLN